MATTEDKLLTLSLAITSGIAFAVALIKLIRICKEE